MSEAHAYVAKMACGCICACMVDNQDHKRDVAKEVGSWLRGGFAVERYTVEDVRRLPFHSSRKPCITRAQAETEAP